MLQDLLRHQQVDNPSVETHIALRILKRIIVLRATSVEVTALKGIPVEALCRLTTEGVQARLAMAGDDELLEIAISYLDAIEPAVTEEVSRIQQTMLGTGCSLSP